MKTLLVEYKNGDLIQIQNFNNVNEAKRHAKVLLRGNDISVLEIFETSDPSTIYWNHEVNPNHKTVKKIVNGVETWVIETVR